MTLNIERRDMQNYQVIVDEDALKAFIEELPDTTVDERYYFCLFARKKYCRDIKYIKSDKSQLARKVASKGQLLGKIKQMECKLGSYLQDDVSIPQEALALYINPNPRCMKRATIQCLQNLAKVIGQDSPGFNPQAEAMSCIQRSCSRKIWTDFDIDTKEPGTLEKVASILVDRSCYKILESRGGYHVLVDTKAVPAEAGRMWYPEMSKLADIKGDCMLPVPGTYQGGFVPRFIEG